MSDSTKDETAPAPRPGRGIVGLGVAALLMLAACLLVRAGGTLVAQTRPPTRLQGILEVLPEVARSGTIVLLGSSTAQRILPEALDDELGRLGQHAISYNLSWQGAAPDAIRLLAERVRQAYAHAGRKADVALFEFGPLNATRRAACGKDPLEAVVLASPREVIHLLSSSPEEASSLFTEKYVLGGVSTGLSDWITEALFGRAIVGPCWFPMPKKFTPELRGVMTGWCADMMKVFPAGVPAWNPQTRGAVQQLYPETRDSYARMVGYRTRPEALAQERSSLIESHDIVDVDLCDTIPDQLTEIVATLSQSAKQVVVLLAPMLARRSPVGKARVRAVLDRLHVPILDFSEDADFTVADFQDLSHLNFLSGAEKYSRKIARGLRGR